MSASFDYETFSQAVYDVVRLIPCGRATTYAAIAKVIGYPRHARMVGRVMGNSSFESGIPAHRVVNSRGMLSGREHFKQHGEMQKRLEAESIVVSKHHIQHWKKVYWSPLNEILPDSSSASPLTCFNGRRSFR